MGVFKAISGAARGAMQDQWLEAFTCDAIRPEILALRGRRMQSERSANHGDENVISVGSLILVPDGACAIVTEMGEVIACYAEPGENRFDGKRSAGIFGGGLSDLAKDVGRRISFGGDAAVVQRIYFINTKEIVGNEWNVQSVPVRLRDENTTLDMDASATAHGTFSFCITEPILFYRQICGNVSDAYERATLLPQIETHLQQSTATALASLCAEGIRPSDLPRFTEAICERIAASFNDVWGSARGIKAVSVALDELTVVPADMAAVQQAQRTKMLTDPSMAAATLTAATADAMTAAAQNTSGGAAGLAFLAMSGSQPRLWHCACGQYNTGRFCEHCGQPKK